MIEATEGEILHSDGTRSGKPRTSSAAVYLRNAGFVLGVVVSTYGLYLIHPSVALIAVGVAMSLGAVMAHRIAVLKERET